MEQNPKTIEEEYLEKKQKQDVKPTRLERRQLALKNFLEKNFESGKFFSIEEICNGVKDENGDIEFNGNKYSLYTQQIGGDLDVNFE